MFVSDETNCRSSSCNAGVEPGTPAAGPLPTSLHDHQAGKSERDASLKAMQLRLLLQHNLGRNLEVKQTIRFFWIEHGDLTHCCLFNGHLQEETYGLLIPSFL